jgi:lysophospholipase L1-like esterase
MGRMKGGMISLILILLLLLVIVASGVAILHIYKNNYKTYNLLKVDPLETGGLKAENLEATLSKSDIWMLGDSRVSRWNEELLNDSNDIANLGVEGQTSSQVYYRFKTYLETSAPSLVILEVGINELKVIGLDKNLTSSITDQFYRNIESIIQICRTKNISLVLINIFPVGKIELSRRLVWNKAVNETIISANHRLQSYCDDIQVYCFDAYSILSENGETVNTDYQSDFMHINNRGYEALSLKLKELINKILNQ